MTSQELAYTSDIKEYDDENENDKELKLKNQDNQNMMDVQPEKICEDINKELVIEEKFYEVQNTI